MRHRVWLADEFHMERFNIPIARLGVLACSLAMVVAGPTPRVFANDPEPILPKVDHLAVAAEFLDRGDRARACSHLAAHLRTNPDELMTRAYLAELLFQTDRPNEARTEFTRFIASAQRSTGTPKSHLVHCHTRLMQLAESGSDSFHEHLHRGIGLYRLVEDDQKNSLPKATRLETLTNAATELRAALEDRPNTARVSLYLAHVYLLLEQPSAARSVVRSATDLIGLTPLEREQFDQLSVRFARR